MANPNPTIQFVRGLYPEVGTTGALVGSDNILQSGLPANDANNPQFIGQCTLREVHHDELEVEDHPIEQGAPISDHTFKKPAELLVDIGWAGQQLINQNRIPVTGVTPSPQYIAQLQAIYAQLIKGQGPPATLYTVLTGKRMYTQMVIQHITTETDYKTENVLAVTLSMRQILVARTQQIAVSAPQNAQANAPATFAPQNQGRTSTTSAPNFNSTKAAAAGAGP